MTKLSARDARDPQIPHPPRPCRPRPVEQHGFINTPIYRGSTVLSDTIDDYQRRRKRYTYGTHGTPTTDALDGGLERDRGRGRHGADALGPRGHHGRAARRAQGRRPPPGHGLGLPADAHASATACSSASASRRPITIRWSVPASPTLFRPNTRAVLVEAPGSQSFEMQDIPAIAAAAHRARRLRRSWTIPGRRRCSSRPTRAASTSPSRRAPNICRGHSDLLLGLTSANARYLAGACSAASRRFAMCAGPEDVFLALRGLRTMELRLQRGRAAGSRHGALARRTGRRCCRCSTLPCPAFPGHEIWKRDFPGSSGLFSVDPRTCVPDGRGRHAGRARAVRHRAIPGAATRASSSPSTAPPTAPRRLGTRAARLAAVDRARGRRRSSGRPRSRFRASPQDCVTAAAAKRLNRVPPPPWTVVSAEESRPGRRGS